MSRQTRAMARQTQGSLIIVGMMTGGIFAVGFVAALVVGGAGFNGALFLAALVATVAAIVLYRGFHSRPDGPITHFATTYETSAAAAQGHIEAPTVRVPAAPTPTPDDLSTGDDSVGHPGDAPSADGDVGVSEPSGVAATETAPESAPSGTATDAETSAARVEVSEPTSDRTENTHGLSEGDSSTGTKPPTMDAPDGEKDDLKMIKGVGPKLEDMLNGMGFYHFHQIAAWGPEEVAWVDDNLEGFKGRVSRDDWVPQAQTLASGGSTEFSENYDKDK